MENFSFYLNIGSVDYGNAYDSNCSAHRCSVTSVICHLQYKCVCVCVLLHQSALVMFRSLALLSICIRIAFI